MMNPIRVAYDINHIPPYIFPCARHDYLITPYTPDCPFPGLSVEIVVSLLRTLQHPIISIAIPNFDDIDSGSEAYDMVGSILPLNDLEFYNLTTTIPIVYDSVSVITTDKPLTDGNDMLAFMKPFTSAVWVGLFVVSLVRKIYTKLMTNMERCQDRTSNPLSASRATLLPIALCMVVFTGLYKSGLLTSLILREKTYLIENLDDIANLPPEVEIRGYVTFREHFYSCCQRVVQDIQGGPEVSRQHLTIGFRKNV